MAWTGTVETLEAISGELSSEGQKLSGDMSKVNNISGSISGAPSQVIKDYELLNNKPKIEGNELIGDKTFVELGLNEITPQEIDDILFGGE